MDILVKEFQAPVIKINYETLKAELETMLKQYEGLVVTEETLAGGKAAQKELASLRVKIDAYRKEKKRELETPIKAFEAQCKELVSLVERVETPIKLGIRVFDDKRREEKRNIALKLIDEVADAHRLNYKHKVQLTVLDKYMNLTASEKAVKDDLDVRAFALRVEQDREAERLDIIKSVLDSENSRLQTKLNIALWQYDIDKGVDTSRIIESIKGYAAKVYEAENAPKEPPKEDKHTETPPETPQAQPEKMYTATFKVTGTLAELRAVSNLLKQNKTSYEVLDQRVV